ncbi:type II site-specific deoxyribonuclease [Helicobacter pylori Hp H-27]|nr:type II site-specific deoxyribonuclease [Helicobacter pylori Hp H-27]
MGKDSNQDLMQAGNAIERAYKNIAEMVNFMLKELHFP